LGEDGYSQLGRKYTCYECSHAEMVKTVRRTRPST
jgi:hypothetical protein